MNIKVTPSKQLDIDISEANEGDLLLVELEKSPPLILTAREHYGEMRLVLDPEHLPLECRDHVRDEMRHALNSDAYGLGMWFERFNTNGRHPYDLLYDAFTLPCLVDNLQVGERPVVYLNDPFAGLVAYSPLRWVVGPKVTNFSPTTKGSGDVERVRVLLEP